MDAPISAPAITLPIVPDDCGCELITIGVGFGLYSTATIATTLGTTERGLLLLSDDPFDRGLVYVASALGTALIAFGVISWVAERFVSNPVVDALRRAVSGFTPEAVARRADVPIEEGGVVTFLNDASATGALLLL